MYTVNYQFPKDVRSHQKFKEIKLHKIKQNYTSKLWELSKYFVNVRMKMIFLSIFRSRPSKAPNVTERVGKQYVFMPYCSNTDSSMKKSKSEETN